MYDARETVTQMSLKVSPKGVLIRENGMLSKSSALRSFLNGDFFAWTRGRSVWKTDMGRGGKSNCISYPITTCCAC